MLSCKDLPPGVLRFRQILNQKTYYTCPICKERNSFADAGTVARKNVMCPVCGSLERHRFLYYVYLEFLNTKKAIKILHTAPEKCFADLILKNKFIDYRPVDICPEHYEIKCEKQDVTNLNYPDNSFDIVLSNHVIEHILDENKFFLETLRVLKPGGKIFLTMPIDFTREKTFEDNSITTPEDRLKYYGQKDHARIYGKDIIDKLKNKYNAKIKYAKDFNIENPAEQRIYENDYVFIIEK